MGRPPFYTVNEKYFNKVSNYKSAYILGFIYADGSVQDRTGLSVCIHKRDLEILEFIRTELKSNHLIKEFNGDYIRVVINRKEIIKDLRFFGIPKNKNNNIELPDIDNSLMSYFLLGYFYLFLQVYLLLHYEQLLTILN